MIDEPYRLNLERKLVHHCTPTLAALKPANLFNFRDAPKASCGIVAPDDESAPERAFAQALEACRAKLEPCGTRIEVLARRTAGALLYVYRPALLMRAIAEERVATYLEGEGYDISSLSTCIERLHRRICGTDLQSLIEGRCSFPHEIGFFLGYPYEDVVGFIENRGENFLCSGCWKVYAREGDALECFCRYKNCTAAYENLYDEGVSIDSLATVDDNFPAAEAFLYAV